MYVFWVIIVVVLLVLLVWYIAGGFPRWPHR